MQDAGSQEPGARSQEPGARSQEPGARSQEPEARSQDAGGRTHGAGGRRHEAGGRCACSLRPLPLGAVTLGHTAVEASVVGACCTHNNTPVCGGVRRVGLALGVRERAILRDEGQGELACRIVAYPPGSGFYL